MLDRSADGSGIAGKGGYMLKLRAMGTTNDLKWFRKIMNRYDVFHVIRMSEPLTMKGTNKFYRMYIELDHIPQKVLDQQRKKR